MRKFTLALLAGGLLTGTAGVALAQDVASAVPAPNNPLGFLAGSCVPFSADKVLVRYRDATTYLAGFEQATRSAVAMSFAGIVYQTENRDARALAQRIEPLAKFFHDAEMQVRTMSPPPSLSRTHGQYADAMALYANAATEHGEPHAALPV